VTNKPDSARSDESAVLPHGRDIDRERSNLLRHLAGAKTVILTSYKRDRTPVATPVSVAIRDERVFFRTYDKAWKVKRLRRDPRIELTPSTFRGKPRGTSLPASARLLQAESDIALARHALAKRHRFLQALAVPLTHRLARYETLHYEVLPRSRNGESTNERS
jgi:PPOX class probable F420-dependent enzyme